MNRTPIPEKKRMTSSEYGKIIIVHRQIDEYSDKYRKMGRQTDNVIKWPVN